MTSMVTFQTLPPPARCAVTLFAAAGCLTIAGTLLSNDIGGSLPLISFLLMGAVTARTKVPLSQSSTLSLLTAVVLLALMMEGTVVAMCSAVCGVTVQSISTSRQIAAHQLAFNVGMVSLAVQASAWTYALVSNIPSQKVLSGPLGGILAAAFVYYLANSLSVSLIIGFSKRISMLRTWRDQFFSACPSFVIAGLVAFEVFDLMTSASVEFLWALMLMLYLTYYASVRLAGQRAQRIS